jgi:hypothetical protein
MKRIFCLLAFLLSLVAPLAAQTVTESASFDVPTALVPELKTLMETYISNLRDQDGALRYPSGTYPTQDARRQAFLDDLLKLNVKIVVKQACLKYPADCPTALAGKITDKNTADTGIATETDNLVQ